jgi:hypothetical protein
MLRTTGAPSFIRAAQQNSSRANDSRVDAASPADDPAPDAALARPSLLGQPRRRSRKHQARCGQRRCKARAAHARITLARQRGGHVRARRSEVEMACLARFG